MEKVLQNTIYANQETRIVKRWTPLVQNIGTFLEENFAESIDLSRSLCYYSYIQNRTEGVVLELKQLLDMHPVSRTGFS